MAKKENRYIPQVVFHPGETLAEKLAEMKMGPKEFAVRTDKPEKTINAVLKGESSITPDMAVQFESVTKIPAHFWMNKQRSFDEYRARERQREIIDESIDWARKFPLTEMIKKGWIKSSGNINEKTEALLSFFGMSNPEAWHKFYFYRNLKVAFRISLAHTSEPYAISAWLRKGELQAQELTVENLYSEKRFKETLPVIKSLMAKHPANFQEKLQSLCLEAGVKVVYTPCLPKAPINGATRWLDETPFIQLTGRYKRNDVFWFTFFHEAGHILLHGKKDVFLENIEYSDKINEKEQEADEFAIKWTLSEQEENEIVSQGRLTSEDVRKYAEKFNTHPAIIIGRLQHKKYIPYSAGKEFIEKVELR
ncbi:ImmA/IrrE family metallo-endopeptidase [Proteiniphilum propionicum]|jgi:addiction module HigA family antidote|uniref:ImmA/IrrE family metallo-endopeptidase n=1 Tax=Proteiniphilum propionicum TaxID=2829812 RepID=UPI001EEAC71E|nr:ImmA/IrrE family metallo-endopeptidase [Proteiniphilum propionicum]ULB33480.1 ImmA/IrrE family metallo-endopeptidase [Proteiniphilum propionicum]